MLEPSARQSTATERPAAMAAGMARGTAERAAEECAEQVLAGLSAASGSGGGAAGVDLLLAFVSPAHVNQATTIGATLLKRLGPGTLVGVSAGGVIGGRIEDETGPGLSVLAASLPRVKITAFSAADLPVAFTTRQRSGEEADDEDDEQGLEIGDLAHLAAAVGFGPEHRGTLLFADPFTTMMDRLPAALAAARGMAAAVAGADGRPAPVVGGLASASPRRKGNALLINDRVLESGLVGVSLGGEVRVEGLVSQGCRGFGPNLVITRAEGQLIEQLGGRPALEVLHEAIEAMGPADRQLLSKGLFVGRVVNEYKDRFGRDDYLIRNVVGVMKDDRALAVADHVRVGQTIRFHVRDAVTATEDLAMLIDGQTLRERAIGAVLVSCNGRGSKLFAEANHDARALARLFDEREGEPGEKKAKSGQEVAMWGDRPPVAGFFAGGEIGPVGDGIFLHGHTACAAIFRRP